MTMDRASLIGSLKASLHDMNSIFTAANDEDFGRHLDHAAEAMAREKRQRTKLGKLTVVADQGMYAAPIDLIATKVALWGNPHKLPYEQGYAGRVPILRTAEDTDGSTVLVLSPAPNAQQINVLGAEFRYYYFATHAIGANAEDTTIQASDRALLLLRAQAEAVRELMFRNAYKPTTLQASAKSSGSPRNMTPRAMWEALMDEWRRTP